jgi:hypothetical protein
MSATLRSLPTKLKPTVRVLFKRTGDTHYVDLGNISKFADAKQVQRLEHFTAMVGDAGQGFARGDGELVTTVSDAYTFTADEVTNDTMRLLQLCAAGTAANQSAGATTAVSVTDVIVGNTYRLGFYGITAHALTFGGSSKTEGTDFSLDYKSGLVTILPGGAIVDGDDIAGTVNIPAGTFKTFTANSEVYVGGACIIELWDQFHASIPRQVISISSATIGLTNFGEMDHMKWTEFQGRIYCNSKPTIKERQD